MNKIATLKALRNMKISNSHLASDLDPVIAYLEKTARPDVREFTKKDLKSLNQAVEREDKDWSSYSHAGFSMELNEKYGSKTSLRVEGRTGRGQGPVLTATIQEGAYGGYKVKALWTQTIELPLYTEDEFKKSPERFYIDMYTKVCMSAMGMFKNHYLSNRANYVKSVVKRRREEALEDFNYGKNALRDMGCIITQSNEEGGQDYGRFEATFNADAVGMGYNTQRVLEGVTALDDTTQSILTDGKEWKYTVRY